MPRPAPYTTGDLLMDVELLRATLQHCRETGTPFNAESYRPLLREAGIRSAYRVLDRQDVARQVDDIFKPTD